MSITDLIHKAYLKIFFKQQKVSEKKPKIFISPPLFWQFMTMVLTIIQIRGDIKWKVLKIRQRI